MKTVILGSGNVAFHLAKAFTESQLPLVQLYGRNKEELSKISSETGVPYSLERIADADLYLIAVSDSAISEVSALITKKDCLVAHTSGSVSINALEGDYRKGVCYPLQTFSKNKKLDYAQIPFFIDAQSSDDVTLLRNMAEKISGKVSLADDEKRKHIHLTAVFACNFVNHLYGKAKEIADSQNIPFHFFWPLIEETAHKIQELEPKQAQTGPAVRGDERVLKMHQELLQDETLLGIYNTLNDSIKATHT